MNTLDILLLLLAFICFLLATVGVALSGRRGAINLTALGLAFWVLVPLITAIRAA